MKKVLFIAIIFLFCSINVNAQKTRRINKYSIGIEIDAGHSSPSFNKEQNRWKGSFYPTGALTLSFRNRINQHWQSDLGIGLTGYALVNKGPFDNYILNFSSPHLATSIQYIKTTNKKMENFVRLKTGMQLGYKGEFTEIFESYTATIKGTNPIIFFISPEIGIRKQFRIKNNRFK